MTEILYYTLIFSLEAILGFVLEWLFGVVHSYGLSIVILSLFVNIFLLKIFILTDKKAEFEAERKKRLDLRIKAWKSVYKKAKLFAFTQTLYRQNRYHPIFALSALGGLAVQIPFFYAMYFVVKNAEIKGVSFLWISDLSAPDVILGVHLLPILMTIISLVNVWIVAKEKGARIQGVIIALIFLVLLYKMPSALVLYWTSNMAFSLIRAIVAKWRQGNSSSGMQFRTCEKFRAFADSKSSLTPKIFHKYKSHTANTRIYLESNVDSAFSQNLTQNPAKSAESNQKNNADSANPRKSFCHFWLIPKVESSLLLNLNPPKKVISQNLAQQTIEGIVVEVAEFLPNLGRETGLDVRERSKFGKSPQDAPKSKLSTQDEFAPDSANFVESKLFTFFTFRKPLKVAITSLTSLLAFLLCATFALHSTTHSAKLKFVENGEAQIDYAINALLRSKSMSAGVEIVGVKWDSDLSNLKLIGNSQRGINFYTPKPLNLKKGASLGSVQFRLDLSPLFKNLFIYYFAILGAVLGIYLLLCVIARFQTYSELHLKSYKTTALYAILCIAFLICVFSPYQLYSTDITQFDSTQTFATLFSLFGAFMLFSFIAIYALSFIPKRFSNFVAFILSAILFSGIIYSFILVGDYGAMDHFVLQKAPQNSAKQMLEFIAVAMFGIALIAFGLKKLMRVWQIAFATLFIVSGVNATNIALKSVDSALDSALDSAKILDSVAESSANPAAPPHLPYERELFSYSKTHKNIVVIVLDAFSGSHTPYILKQFPHLKTALDGFTLFPNTISTTNSTIHSIATLIGGEYYSAYNMNARKPNLAQEIDRAFIETSNAFARANFSVALMAFVGSKIENLQTNSEVFALDAGSGAFLNYYIRSENLFEVIKANTAKNSKYIQTAQLTTFGLFKFAPKPFHSNIYNDGLWLFRAKLSTITPIRHAATFYAPTHILNADSAKPTFKYFHSMITHTPYGMYFHNNKCEFFSDKSAFADYPHKVSMDTKYAYQHFDTEACALKYLTHFVANLKHLGIYDNTQIFVVSDHGGGGPINIPIGSRPDALLLFKDFGSKGALKVDNRLMANYDISSMFCENIKSGCPNVGQNILKNYPQNREIIHTIPSAWQLERHRKNEWYITKAYKVQGNIYNAKNWVDISDEKYGIVNVGGK